MNVFDLTTYYPALMTIIIIVLNQILLQFSIKLKYSFREIQMRRSCIKTQTSMKVIGMMSGTSLDGVDFAFCQFTRSTILFPNMSPWRYHLIACRTFEYPKYVTEFIARMQSPNTTFLQFKKLQLLYTKFIIETLNLFTTQFNIFHYDLLSVHGHTIFHQPQQSITVQVLNLNYLAGQLKVDVCGNFRELDVCRGGQGAPLAPFGEQIFAGEAFINFGGIANISYRKKGYDINFCNLFLNYVSQKYYNCQYDKDGEFGRQGTPNDEIIEYFINHSVFKLGHSLARQQFQLFMSQTQTQLSQHKICDILASYYNFLSGQIVKMSEQLIQQPKISVMCTGGGAKNKFLLQLINSKSKFEFIVPNQELIDFKEAIIFAFLGVKMMFGEVNCASGVGGNYVKGSVVVEGNESSKI